MFYILFIYILSVLLYIPIHKIYNMYSNEILELEDRDFGIMFCPIFNTLIIMFIIVLIVINLVFDKGVWDNIKQWVNNK